MIPAKLCEPEITPAFLDAIATFPPYRDVSHCGTSFRVPSFDLYATCPECGTRIKVRGFSGVPEFEDVFDTVFAWMASGDAAEVAKKRIEEVRAEI
jgi:hypothetical protein